MTRTSSWLLAAVLGVGGLLVTGPSAEAQFGGRGGGLRIGVGGFGGPGFGGSGWGGSGFGGPGFGGPGFGGFGLGRSGISIGLGNSFYGNGFGRGFGNGPGFGYGSGFGYGPSIGLNLGGGRNFNNYYGNYASAGYGYGSPGYASGYFSPAPTGYSSGYYTPSVAAPTVGYSVAPATPSYIPSTNAYALDAGTVAPALPAQPQAATVLPAQPQVAMPAVSRDQAQVRVLVPDPDAQVWFDGQKTAVHGSMREFVTPALDPNSDYSYTVTAAWSQDGRVVTQERRVNVRAGSNIVIDFSRQGGANNNADRQGGADSDIRGDTSSPNAPSSR